MKRPFAYLIGILWCGLALSAPAKETRMHLIDMFDHAMHTQIFEGAESFDCTLCHRTDDSYNREKVDLRGCHMCHNNPKAPIPANNDCSMCHGATVQPIRPKNHTKGWRSIHPVMAKQDAKNCAACHQVAFCIDCHQQRDTVRQTRHLRNFRFFHSVEARANPASCDRCHTVVFCTNCHQQRGIP
ncbi:MAG: hypothetical protein HYV02_05460 [Deltaproteobacteria bacterium]|nr:hypothetical protein [Deltaproteobacteria bacterium]